MCSHRSNERYFTDELFIYVIILKFTTKTDELLRLYGVKMNFINMYCILSLVISL